MIDWDRVAQLRDEVGPDDFGEVVELFLEEVDEATRRLRDRPDPTRFEDDLHFLKGSALNLGFAAFGALCQAGERQAKEGRAHEVDLKPILECNVASRQEFLEMVPRAAA